MPDLEFYQAVLDLIGATSDVIVLSDTKIRLYLPQDSGCLVFNRCGKLVKADVKGEVSWGL